MGRPALLERVAALFPGVLYQVILDPGGALTPYFISGDLDGLLGLPPSSMVESKRVLKAMFESDPAGMLACTAASGGETGQWERLFRCNAGGFLSWIQSVATPVRLENGGILWTGVLLSHRRPVAEAAAQTVHDVSLPTAGTPATFLVRSTHSGAPVCFGSVQPLEMPSPFRSSPSVETGDRMELAMRATGDGLWDWNVLTGEVHYSDRYRELLGYNASEFPDTLDAFRAKLHPDDAALTEESAQDHFADGALFQVSHRLLCRDGVWRWFESRGHAVRDASGQIQRMVGSIRNVTEVKEMIERIRQTAEQLEQAKDALESQSEILMAQAETLVRARDDAEAGARAKAEFLATMSHEIRTPMNAVIGMTSILAGSGLNEEQADYVETIRKSGDALLTVINDILDFSKIEAGKMSLEARTFSVRDTVEQAAELFIDKAHGRNLELTFYVDDAVADTVIGDDSRIRQILLNLLSNAMKFTDKGGVSVAVHAVGKQGDSVLLRFEVSDTGMGIPPDRMSLLFQAFSQTDVSTTRRFGGTGLGLAICRRLAEMMGGQIGADSVPGEGSCFWFTVRAGLGTPAAVMSFSEGFSGKRVLVVDDNRFSLQALERSLRALQITPHLVQDGEAAVAEFASAHEKGEHFDAVMIDLEMPGWNGLEVYERVREISSGKTPAVLMVSFGPGSKMDRLRERGIDLVLTKPVRQRHVRRVLGAAFGIQLSDKTAAAPEETGNNHLRGKRILEAEDNVVNQRVISLMLKRLGCEVEIAGDGLEAVQACGKASYDLVLMDWQMPHLDGLEATVRIRQMEGTRRRTPIVALTANAFAADRDQCLQAGMDGFLTKPIQMDALLSALKKSLFAPVAAPAAP